MPPSGSAVVSMSGIFPPDRLKVETRAQTQRMMAIDRLDRYRVEELRKARGDRRQPYQRLRAEGHQTFDLVDRQRDRLLIAVPGGVENDDAVGSNGSAAQRQREIEKRQVPVGPGRRPAGLRHTPHRGTLEQQFVLAGRGAQMDGQGAASVAASGAPRQVPLRTSWINSSASSNRTIRPSPRTAAPLTVGQAASKGWRS